jgi:hypothetical protein
VSVILVYFLRLLRCSQVYLKGHSYVGAFAFNIFINYLCDVIKHSKCRLFGDDHKIYLAISSPSDCLLLQSDIDRAHNWCLANSTSMRPNFSKIRFVSFTRKTNVPNYQYRLGSSVILRNDCIKDLGMHTDCKLHFHRHVDFLFHTYIFLFYH